MTIGFARNKKVLKVNPLEYEIQQLLESPGTPMEELTTSRPMYV